VVPLAEINNEYMIKIKLGTAFGEYIISDLKIKSIMD
jgi:hypothetical protein